MAITEEVSVQPAAGVEPATLEQVGENATETKPFKPKIVWFNAIGFLILHLCALYGGYLIVSGQIMAMTVLWSLMFSYVAGISVTLGAHRLWTHKSFKAKLPLRILLLIGHTIAGQNCLWVWVRDHRQHHKYSDTDADPHNATRGFWFSHLGWLMMKKHPEVIAKGKHIDMSDIEADPYIMFQKKYYKTLYLLFAFLLPVCVPYYFWGETFKGCLFVAYFFRYMFGINCTWSVNSVAHLWGTRPYTRHIKPVESPLVAFLAAGEGWHNFHHTFPWDCNAAELGMDLNNTSTVLRFFEKIGWAYDLRYASEGMVRHRVQKYGDNTHHKYST